MLLAAARGGEARRSPAKAAAAREARGGERRSRRRRLRRGRLRRRSPRRPGEGARGGCTRREQVGLEIGDQELGSREEGCAGQGCRQDLQRSRPRPRSTPKVVTNRYASNKAVYPAKKAPAAEESGHQDALVGRRGDSRQREAIDPSPEDELAEVIVAEGAMSRSGR